jgi:hypothetical protein
MTQPTPWTPEFELDYVRHTSFHELMERHASHYFAFGVREIVESLPEQSVIMDVGCGSIAGMLRCIGCLGSPKYPGNPKGIAVDPLMDDYAKGNTPPQEWFECRAEFAHALSQPSSSVHLLICIETLDHCENMDQFRASQAELARVLVPDGRLLFMLPARSGPCDGHPCCPTSAEVIDEFKRLGLEVERHEFKKPNGKQLEGTWLILRKAQQAA